MFILQKKRSSLTNKKLIMLAQNKTRIVGPYIPIWNRKSSRDDGERRKVVSWSSVREPLPHIRIQLKDSKCVQKSIRNVLVPSSGPAVIDPGNLFM